MLHPFSGVLISDFYTAYDSLNCEQQKCLVHFVRDIDDDVLKNPLDTDLKGIAQEFGILLRAIIETVDRYGLKRRHLRKHKPAVLRFLDSVASKDFSSALADSTRNGATSTVTIKPNHLNGLLVALIGVVLVPGVIVIASLILGTANESAGWLRYRLPEVFFWIFLSTGIASPFLGIGTLVFLWILRRRPALVDGSKTDPKMRRAAHSRGSDCHRCPGCLDRCVQRGLLRGGWEPVETNWIRPVLKNRSALLLGLQMRLLDTSISPGADDVAINVLREKIPEKPLDLL